MPQTPKDDQSDFITRVGGRSFPALEFTRLTCDLISGGKSFKIAVHGKSMVPFIYSGDLVTLVPLAGKRLRVGDVVALRLDNNSMILHRVVKLTKTSLQTKGDNRTSLDSAVPYGAVIARLSVIIREGKPVYWALGGVSGWLVAHLSLWSLLQPLVKTALWLKSPFRQSTVSH